MIQEREIKITAIQGIAGTSKTTTLAKLISKVPKESSFVGIALTHHAVKNLLKKVRQFDPYTNPKRFRTIHSFFRISIRDEFFVGSSGKVDYVFIDEFSMIDKELFKRIVQDLKKNGTIEIFLAGDFLQLPRVGTLKDSIEIETLKKLKGMTLTEEMIIPLQHFDNSCLSMIPNIVRKTKQYRNENNIFLKWLVNDEFSDHLDELPFVSFRECLQLLKNGYILIASKYKILESFRNELNPIPQKGDFIYGTETIDDIVNGNIYVIQNVENDMVLAREIETDELIFFSKPWKFYPLSFYTFHKSQGLTFENIIVCTDELFEFPMLYTGISRSSGDIKFYSSKDQSERNEYLKTHSGQKQIKIMNEMFQRILSV